MPRPALQPVRDWRVHIGAHKTATTHLQATLLAMRDDLVRQGVDYLPMEEVRPILNRTRSASGRRGLLTGKRFTRAETWSDLQALRRGPRRIVVSEEDILGQAKGLLQANLYPDFERIARMRRLARPGKSQLFLSVRAFDGIVQSAYFEVIKSVPSADLMLEGALRSMRDTPPSWTRLAERVRAAWPRATLQVWRHEDYAIDPRPILRALTGIEDLSLPDTPIPESTRSPSSRALGEVRSLDPQLPKPERRERVREIFSRHPRQPGEPAAQILSADEAGFLREIYEADMAHLARRFPGILITPETP